MSLGFLSEIAEKASTPQYSVIQLLRQLMAGKAPNRPWLPAHASDITGEDYCPREVALHDLLKRPRPERYVSSAKRATWDIGKATERVVRDQWAVEKVWGHWTCPGCKDLRMFCQRPPELGCGSTGKLLHQWTYKEVMFTSSSYGFTGSFDMFLNLGAPKLYMTEIKIMAPDMFKKLKAPLREHRVRTSLYLHLIEDSGTMEASQINTRRAYVLYVSRGHGAANENHAGSILPFREYVVERDDDDIKPALVNAAGIRDYQRLQRMPSGICPTPMCKRAKWCRVSKECFSGKFPAYASS